MTSEADRSTLVITGGGTAGHTNPGIAVAQALVAKGLDPARIHFVGGERGNEGTLVAEAGFAIDLLPGRGFERRLHPAAWPANLAAARSLLAGFAEAIGVMRRVRPAAVLCLGGYAAAPASLVAMLTRIPIVVTEQNARASAVNRLVGRVARVCALPYPGVDLPNGVLTGNPIRPAVVEAVTSADRATSLRRLGLPTDRLVVAVWSGSLGARSVNRAVHDLAELWADRSDVAIYHVVGRRDFADFEDHPPAVTSGRLIYKTVDYEHRMPLLLSAADVAVCRAGASTTAELAVAGLPAVLVPLPGAPRDHQTANTAELVAAGGALLLPDAELDGATLAARLEPSSTIPRPCGPWRRRRRRSVAPKRPRPSPISSSTSPDRGSLHDGDPSEADPMTARPDSGASNPPEFDMLDLSHPRRIHLVGVGGSGMSAIAEILVGTGHEVTGSDLTESLPLQRLASRGLAMHVGHDPAHLGDAEVVAISTAIPATNSEVVAAREAGLPVLRRSELLAAITSQWRTVAIAGTHGKTTTSAMLAACLLGAGLDPAYLVGGDLRDLGRGAGVGSGDILVVEADESDGTFVELAASAVIVTNVEPDHLEHYGGFAGLEQAFIRFVVQCDGPCVVCIDDPGASRLAALGGEHRIITYGTAPASAFRIVDPLPTPVGVEFTIAVSEAAEFVGGRSFRVRLRQPGMHNARNATAAFAMGIALGADPEALVEALGRFGGVGRRFEDRGSAAGVRLVDDYAHLPTEVLSALSAARSLDPRRLVAVFQPHRYSRTEQLWSTFGDSFVDADILIVTGLYAAGETPRPGIGGHLIADEVRRLHPDADVRYVESLDDVLSLLGDVLRDGDLCITLGAGDLTQLPSRLLPLLEGRARS